MTGGVGSFAVIGVDLRDPHMMKTYHTLVQWIDGPADDEIEQCNRAKLRSE
jgi:hypothetical protein